MAADGTELSQVAHTEHAPWRADGRGKKKKSESSVISHCVPTSFGVYACDTAPEHIFRPRDLFFNQWPPLPGSRDTPPQDFISVSEHNWLVSSLEGGGIMQGKNITAQSLFKDFWSK